MEFGERLRYCKNIMLRKTRLWAFFWVLQIFLSTALPAPAFAQAPAGPDNKKLRPFLDKVFQTMDDHYYLPVSRQVYDDFLKNYPAETLWALNEKTHQTENYLHLGAGLLVSKLKSPKDRFTNFVPPDKTKKFKDNAYAVTEDLGIEGKKDPEGFLISRVEKHCDAYTQGVRAGDRILEIGGESLKKVSEEEIQKKLKPEVGSKTRLLIRFSGDSASREIILESKSYFKETVERLPSPGPGILAVKISHFNQKTSKDFAEVVTEYGPSNIQKLIIDLRGNGGGPPLAAREILGYFLPTNDFLFAIARKKQRPVMMTSPPETLRYTGDLDILVDSKTGSAAEMFSGVLQAKKRARLIGQRTAGATYLKSIYDFEDGSMVFMLTSLTFFFDKRVFPADGLTPDVDLAIPEDAMRYASKPLR